MNILLFFWFFLLHNFAIFLSFQMITGISDGITWKSDKNDLFTLTYFRIFKLSYFFPKVITMTWTHVFVSFGLFWIQFVCFPWKEKKRSKKHQKSIFFSKKIKKHFFLNFFFPHFFTIKFLPKMWHFFLNFFSHLKNMNSLQNLF